MRYSSQVKYVKVGDKVSIDFPYSKIGIVISVTEANKTWPRPIRIRWPGGATGLFYEHELTKISPPYFWLGREAEE